MVLETPRPLRAVNLAAALTALVVLVGACSGGGPVSRNSQHDAGGLAVTSGLTRFDVADRQPAPVASGTSLDGTRTVSTADYPGKIVVLNVWESSCGPCRAETPDLVKASDDTKKVATFIGLNARDRQAAAAQAFIRSNGVGYPQIFDPTGEQLLRFSKTLPLSSIPTTLVIDEHGKIAARIIGSITSTSLVQLINDIHSGR